MSWFWAFLFMLVNFLQVPNKAAIETYSFKIKGLDSNKKTASKLYEYSPFQFTQSFKYQP